MGIQQRSNYQVKGQGVKWEYNKDHITRNAVTAKQRCGMRKQSNVIEQQIQTTHIAHSQW